MAAAATAPNINQSVINVGSGTETGINDLIRLISKVTGRDPHTLYVGSQDAGVSRMRADLTRARILLGYEPRVTLEDGLRRVINEDERFALKQAAD
jgi:UDP-glucose 4-epimerase